MRNKGTGRQGPLTERVQMILVLLILAAYLYSIPGFFEFKFLERGFNEHCLRIEGSQEDLSDKINQIMAGLIAAGPQVQKAEDEMNSVRVDKLASYELLAQKLNEFLKVRLEAMELEKEIKEHLARYQEQFIDNVCDGSKQ